MAFGLTLNHVLVFIEQALCELYDLAHHFGVDREVMSSAVFVFDQRLSIFIPSCARDLTDVRRLFDVTGVASLFIAAKSQLARRDLTPIEKFIRGYPHTREVFQVELKILVELEWNIVSIPLQFPLSVIFSLCSLLHAAIKGVTMQFKHSRNSFYMRHHI